jgi:hypothetical protein
MMLEDIKNLKELMSKFEPVEYMKMHPEVLKDIIGDLKEGETVESWCADRGMKAYTIYED